VDVATALSALEGLMISMQDDLRQLRILQTRQEPELPDDQ
jgi:hypothetical protein